MPTEEHVEVQARQYPSWDKNGMHTMQSSKKFDYDYVKDCMHIASLAAMVKVITSPSFANVVSALFDAMLTALNVGNRVSIATLLDVADGPEFPAKSV